MESAREFSTSPVGDTINNPGPVRWSPADLDRCEHGRHSTDSCWDCPDGMSSGNVFLAASTRVVRQLPGGGELVRIGTMVHGEPIWVAPNRRAK